MSERRRERRFYTIGAYPVAESGEEEPRGYRAHVNGPDAADPRAVYCDHLHATAIEALRCADALRATLPQYKTVYYSPSRRW